MSAASERPAASPSRYWTCANVKCGYRNESRKRKCVACGRAKRKSRSKAQVHPQDTYETYLQVAREIHGVTDESCCVCGRPRKQETRHHREHDHRTGLPRGIACFRCNKELLRHATLEQARLVVAYLERVEAHYR